jgi:DNA polymerase-3 subunit gamma/tau
MSYQVLARKWRPQTFAEIVGQEAVTTILTNAITQDRVHHAFLFAGTRGVGKTTTARILAKSLNCRDRTGPEPCNTCESCREITADSAMDVLEIDGASNRGIDDIRDLRENVRYAPSRDTHKIFIIDEVHQLTKEAFNALLKTLEEPPPHVVFIMATTELNRMPATILSRCLVAEFKQIAAGAMFDYLARLCTDEGVTIGERSLQLVTRVAAGSMRDALSTLDQVISFCGREVDDAEVLRLLDVTDFDLLQQAAEAMVTGDAAAVFTLVHRLQEKGHDLNRYCRDLITHMRNMMLVKLFGPENSTGDGSLATLTAAERQELAVMAERFTEPNLIWCVDLLLKTDQEVKWASQPAYLLESALVKLAQQARLQPLEEILRRLDNGPAPAGGGAGRGGNTGPQPGRQAAPATSTAPAATTAPPAPSAAPAPPTPRSTERPAGTVDGLLSAIQKSKPALHGMLGLASGIRFTDGELVIEFAENRQFQMEQVGRSENMKSVRELARHQFGKQTVVRLEQVAGPASAAEPEPAPPSAPPPEPPPAQAVPEPAAAPSPAARDNERGAPPTVDDPLIQKALDLFGGQIVSVEPPDTGAEQSAEGGQPEHG